MNYTEIKKIHKKLQKSAKENKSESNRIFIRHWNVFYNHIRGRDLSVIEEKGSKPLLTKLIDDISNKLELDPQIINCDYTKDLNPSWHIRNSDLFDLFNSEVINE